MKKRTDILQKIKSLFPRRRRPARYRVSSSATRAHSARQSSGRRRAPSFSALLSKVRIASLRFFRNRKYVAIASGTLAVAVIVVFAVAMANVGEEPGAIEGSARQGTSENTSLSGAGPEAAATPSVPASPTPEPEPTPPPWKLERDMDDPKIATLQERLMDLGVGRGDIPAGWHRSR